MRSKYRSPVSILLAICLLLGVVPMVVFATDETPSSVMEPVVTDGMDDTQPSTEEELPLDQDSKAPEPTVTPPQDTGAPQNAEKTEPAATTEISGTVVWVNQEQQSSADRPVSVTLTLYANGAATDHIQTVSAPAGGGSSWPFTFKDLPAANESGPIYYTVSESPIPDYETSYSADTCTITNSYTGGTPGNHTFGHIDVRIAGANLEMQYVVKNENGQVISRDTKTIEAYVTKVESVTINGTTYDGSGFEKSGSYEFRKLRGVSIPSSSLTSSSTAVLVVDLRDSEGNVYDNISITYGLGGIMAAAYACDGYRNGKFDGLDFVVGAALNYKIEIHSYGLEIGVQKYIQSGNQPAAEFSGAGGEFSFQLAEYADGAATGRTWTIFNNASGAGSVTVTYPYQNLAELEAYAGKIYSYTLRENAGADSRYQYDTTEYTFTVGFTVSETENDSGGVDKHLRPYIREDAYAGGTFSFTNRLETTSVSGRKIWEDADNQDNLRPDSITIYLLKNGEIAATKTVTAADNWAWSFPELPKYDENGMPVSYSIEEDDVKEYTTSYHGYDVVNTHIPLEVSVAVSKRWDDHDNQDRIRPESVTVQLLADGQDTGKTLVLSQENNWTGSFTKLDAFRAGKAVSYTVTEAPVEGYKAAITGTAEAGFIITNTHTPETVEVSGRKTWEDENNQDQTRPASITINLLKNGEIVASKAVTAADDWAWSFTGLAKYQEAGVENQYSISENAVPGYSASYDGYNVTNRYTPQKTSVTVTKVWVDSGNADGLRPKQITVKLLADGTDTGKTLVLSAKNNWTGSFTGLSAKVNGKTIRYTVEETAVKGYSATVCGSMEQGFVITNTGTTIPKTGDSRTPGLWLALMLASAGVLAGAGIYVRKRRRTAE